MKAMKDMIHRPAHLELFGNAIQTIEKFLKPTFKMDAKYSRFIPILLSILHNYNVIRFETESSGYQLFFMIDLHIPTNVDMDRIATAFKKFNKQ